MARKHFDFGRIFIENKPKNTDIESRDIGQKLNYIRIVKSSDSWPKKSELNAR